MEVIEIAFADVKVLANFRSGLKGKCRYFPNYNLF